MRVENFHRPPTGLDNTKMTTEEHAKTTRRNCETVSHLRLRNLDDDRRNEKETPNNATKSVEDHESRRRETSKKVLPPHTAGTPTLTPTKPHDPGNEPEDDTTEANPPGHQRARRKQPRRRQHFFLQQCVTRRRSNRRRARALV